MEFDETEEMLRNDLAGLIRTAREYGPNSEETKRYFLDTLQHYDTKKSKKEYHSLAGPLLLLIDISYNVEREHIRGRLSLTREGRVSIVDDEGNISLVD